MLESRGNRHEGRSTIETQDALRNTSDQLLRDLDALTQLEEEKRNTPQGDVRLVEIASRVEELARRVLDQTQRQMALSASANREAATGDAPASAMIATARRNPGAILAEWRAAEREAQAAAPDSVAALESRARADRLRDEYREAFDAAKGS
jgi:hypothetical protein